MFAPAVNIWAEALGWNGWDSIMHGYGVVDWLSSMGWAGLGWTEEGGIRVAINERCLFFFSFLNHGR